MDIPDQFLRHCHYAWLCSSPIHGNNYSNKVATVHLCYIYIVYIYIYTLLDLPTYISIRKYSPLLQTSQNSSMLWYLKLTVLLATSTAIPVGREYYPSDCYSETFEGTDCVLTCRGKDACNSGISIPRSTTLKNFIVRCVPGVRNLVTCNSLQIKNARGGVSSYFMCIPKKSCNSVERAASIASFVYCEPECGRIPNKRVKTTTTKNGKPVVIFDNGVAVARSSDAKGKDMGIISNGTCFYFFYGRF